MSKPSLRAFQITNEQFSYSTEFKSWERDKITVHAVVYLKVSFIYRGEEYTDQSFAVTIRSPEEVNGEKVYNAIKIEPPLNFYREFINKKAYSEGMRTASTEAVLDYVRSIPSAKLESETRKAVLNKFDSVVDSKMREIEELKALVEKLGKQRFSFSSLMMNNCAINISEDQFSREVFR